jgi:hypothetical protein
MTDGYPHRNGERSISELVKDLSNQGTELARKEAELARAEMQLKARRLGIGAGAFSAAGLIGLFAFAALTATLILALATAMAGWLAALIITVVYAATAGVAALLGKRKLDEGTPPVPERAIDTTKEDAEYVKQSAKEGRS